MQIFNKTFIIHHRKLSTPNSTTTVLKGLTYITFWLYLKKIRSKPVWPC